MGGSMGIDYPYESSNPQYQLWKPPGNYYPRGEAPPPYEEAVALAQAESLNTCTVSVATSTHRTMPNVCTESAEPQSNITTNTTNLINININNAGNITAVAAGENHLVNSNNNNNSYNTTPTNTLTQAITNNPNNEISDYNESNTRNTAQYQSYSSYNPNCNSLTRDICTNQNCDLNIANNCNLLRSPAGSCRQNYHNINRNQIPKEVQTSDQSIILLSTNSNNKTYDQRHQMHPQNASSSNLCEMTMESNNKILPPPLFDNNAIMNSNNNAIAEAPKISSQKRYHRTIPRHFQAVDPLLTNQMKATSSTLSHSSSSNNNNSNNNNKKPTCQCPVQHVPMTYMATNHYNNQGNNPGNLFISKMSSNSKQSNVKHHKMQHYQSSQQQLASSSGPLKLPTISKQNDDNAILIGSINAQETESGAAYASHSLFNLSNTEAVVQPEESSTLKRNKSNNHHGKITSSVKKSSPSTASTPTSSQQHQIHSILKNSNKVNNTAVVAAKVTPNYEIINSPFSFQLMGLAPINKTHNHSNSNDIQQQQHHQQLTNNPALPPKMHKSNNNSCSNLIQNNTNSYYSNSKIHTITRPQELGQLTVLANRMSFPSNGMVQQNNFLTKSLSRGTDLSEKSQKIHSSSSSSYYNSNNNNTLPKNSNGKMASRSSISEVVNKVPSIINIPTSVAIMTSIITSTTTNTTTSANNTTPITSSLSSSSSSSMNSISSTLPKKLSTKVCKFENTKINAAPNNTDSTTAGPSVPKVVEKPLPVLTTSNNCINPKEHFLPNDTSLDDEYLSECENCKSAHGSRYYLEEELEETPQETMTLQRKMPDNNEEHEQQNYYRVSSTLPTNTNKKNSIIKNREPWFSTIPASSSSDEEACE